MAKWTDQELQVLFRNNGLDDAALAALLPGRTAGAVGAMRAAVHAYHTGGSPSYQPSQAAQRWINARRRTLNCPYCGGSL